MEVNLTETNKGAKSLICDGFRYRVDKVLKSKEISWRCTAKSCSARVRTDENGSMIVQQKNTHNHDVNDRENQRHVLRVRAKRKADDDISQRPSKIIRGELKTMTEEHLQTSDLKYVSKAIDRKRRKTHPPILLSFKQIKMRSIDEVQPKSLVSLYEQYCSEQISTAYFVKTLGFKYQARTDL